MGRKIPGKKHRGVKDPDRQRTKRLSSLKGKINAPPSNPDHQEIPHSVNHIAELKDKYTRKKYGDTTKEIPHNHNGIRKYRQRQASLAFKQGKNESDRQFLYRVNQACNSVIQQSKFETKYNVQVKRDAVTGEVEKLVKTPIDELDRILKKSRKKTNKNKAIKPTKSEKWQRKRNEKKQRHKIQSNGDSNYNEKDTVQFGEVVHEPPVLCAPRKALQLNSAQRPGQKNLLLKSLVQGKTLDKTAKRKHLPNALRRQLDKQQTEIIDAYRLIKKQRNAPYVM